MDNEDRDIHKGHRQRMRRKFADYSARPFDTYELLEMLLYNVIPYKDTNPVSKKLLSHFGSLDAVLSAPEETLVECDGVGDAAAGLILAAGALTSDEGVRLGSDAGTPCFDDYFAAGQFFSDYFSETTSFAVAMMLLDNKMHLIGVRTLYELDYCSGAVRPEPFIEYALENRAAAAIIAHTHPHGPLYPSHGDTVTNAVISSTLASAGVALTEHYIVSGRDFAGMLKGGGCTPPPAASHDGARKPVGENTAGKSRFEILLSALLRYAVKEPALAARALVLRYHDMTALAAAEAYALASVEHVGEGGAHLLRLAFALRSRRITDAHLPGKAYNATDFRKYLTGLFFDSVNETVYAFFLDDRGRVAFSELLGEGTVNSMTVLPRKILELSIKRGCKRVILAHNHPAGEAVPSNDDVAATEQIARLLSSTRRELVAHYVVAGNCVTEIKI